MTSTRTSTRTSTSTTTHETSPATGWGFRFHETGGPEVLRYEELPTPSPGPGQVRVRVAASAYNAADNGMRGSFLPIPVELPHVPGYDVSGTVDAIGEGVQEFSPGDPVVGFLPMERDGGAAQFVLAPAEALVAAPATIPLADAAALPSVALTAWQALVDDGDVHPGQRLLVVGAGGVVGKYAIALAARAGVHVVATASPRSAEDVRAAGAHEVVDHTRTDLIEAVTEPVDVLLNLAPLEPERFAALVALVRDGGRVVSTTAFLTTPGDEARGVDAVTVFVRPDRERLAELVRLVDAGELRVEVTRRVPLAELPALHAEGAAGRIPGKVVVVVE
ncbi:NADP-dependent oxidoreductase [Kineococcus sp. TBRC 1896]|uniref:NADP-dependent oxidoreductase n=1 Tax=Kineococcus mangrovi TaxID=1660183 RepID=A0ABV4HYL7_9ACTN